MAMKLTFLCNYEDTQNPFKNFAIEEYLMNQCEEGEVILFLWQNKNTVVVGRNQNVWNECKVEELEKDGGLLTRRLSGGGAVYHDIGNMNFSFFAKKGTYDVAKQLSVIVDAVASFGIHAEKSGRNDIKIDGRKFSGNAFYKAKDRCYHHGTLLISEDMKQMVRYLNVDGSKMNVKGVKSVPSLVVNLSTLNPAITVDSLRDALKESFGKIYGLPVHTILPSDIKEEDIKERTLFFSSPEWRFNEKSGFTHRFEGRYDWGFIKIYMNVVDGVVEIAHLDSDGLEADLLASFPALWQGKLFDRHLLAEAIRGISLQSEEEIEVVRDTAALLENEEGV